LSRAYFTPYGVGLGHASRLIMVAEILKKYDVNVRFSSFGEAASYIVMNGYDCNTVPPLDFAWSAEGGFSIKNSIANIPRWLMNFSRQVNCETVSLAQFNPEIVVSDSRLSSVLTAKLLGIPAIVVLNQIKLLLSPRLRQFKMARSFEKINGEFLGLLWTMADKILVPDLPPPYTIAECSIWDTDSVTKKLQYIGFTSPRSCVSVERINQALKILSFTLSDPIVFIHISGPTETRIPIAKIAIEACRALHSNIQYVISEGSPRGTHLPKKLAGSGWYYEWCPIRDEIFAMSDLVVLRGGHAAITQAVQFGKPIISIPIANHGEQIGNSEKISKIGSAIMIKGKQPKPKEITDAIHRIIYDTAFKKKAEELFDVSLKFNGIDNAVNIIRSYI
jgi:UDP-N-acetylglucosamine--N-acetylmuramyl-(pentapeptide) pyrophosphoryl-undecaprenol N-acetylglucosamine transferase